MVSLPYLPGQVAPVVAPRNRSKERAFPQSMKLEPLALRTDEGAAGASAGTASVNVALAIQPQEQSNWCWCAVATSVGLFFQTGAWTQCRVATQSIPKFTGWDGTALDCCASSASCNSYGYLDVALETTASFGSDQAGPIGFSDLSAALTKQQPVCVRILWNPVADGAAHFVAIIGCSTDPSTGVQYIDVADPATGSTGTQPFGDPSDPTSFPNTYDGVGGDWSFTYFTVNQNA
jgi:hypothetical protein